MTSLIDDISDFCDLAGVDATQRQAIRDAHKPLRRQVYVYKGTLAGLVADVSNKIAYAGLESHDIRERDAQLASKAGL